MAKMRPQKGKPQAPKAPTKPVAGKTGRRVSKTNDPKCTQAMSLLQKAIKSGQRPTAEVNATLAMCRNRQRRKLDAPQRKKRLAKIQELRRSGDRGKALEMARADRKGQTARNEAAALLRQLRQGRGSNYARQAQSNSASVDRRDRGNELLARLREVTPASTLRRAGRHARGDRSYEQRRQERRSTRTSEPKPTPEPTPEPVRPTFTPEQLQNQRRLNASNRAGSYSGGVERQERAAILSRLRQTRSGQAIIADVRRRMPNAQSHDYRFAVNDASSQASLNLHIIRDRKTDAIRDRVRNAERPERDMLNRVRSETARSLATLRAARQATSSRGSWSSSSTNADVQFIRAATSTTGRIGDTNRRRATQSGRDAYTAIVDTARARSQSSPTQTSAPVAPSTPTGRTRRTRTTQSLPATTNLVITDHNSRRIRRLSDVPQSQLDAARQQSGNFTGYETNSRYDATVRGNLVSNAEATLKLKLHGNTTDEKFSHLMALSGIPPQGSANLEFRISNGQGIFSYTDRHGTSLNRTITYDSTNNIVKIHNDYFVPQGPLKNDGHPMDIYSRSILAARSAGVHVIDVDGGRGRGPNGMTGYAVWPGYGFDHKFDASDYASKQGRDVIRNAHPELANVTHISQALFHPDPNVAQAARDAWKINGPGMLRYQLDLTDPNSTSFQNFQKFWKRRRNGQDFNSYNSTGNASINGDFNAYT